MNLHGEVDFQVYDYLIGGKMVVGKATLDDSYVALMTNDSEARLRVKEKLIREMADYILQHKLVEFTQWDDPLSGRKHVAVRAYLAPDDQVKVLRLANKI